MAAPRNSAPPATLVREPLPGPTDPLDAARWIRNEPRPVALSGAWAGGGTLLTSHPLQILPASQDPFAALDTAPVDTTTAAEAANAVGGGWFGWFGFGLARTLEPVPPAPPRPNPLPAHDLAFHDHVVRCDPDGRWWFEALWSSERAAVLEERLATWRARIASAAPPPAAAVSAAPLQVTGAGTAGHAVAVAEVIERIAEGEISQANLCLRLEAAIEGDPLELWIRAAAAAKPSYAAFIGADGRAVVSLSPELFLRRSGRGRIVESRPVKGTAPLNSDPAALRSSAKDRAENVMIVDLMRNDLGRVCEYGTIEVPALWEVEAAAGVWHLVSTVRGRLRDGLGDAALLGATFPPGSVTGAPKVQALKVIHRLESTGREAYCGAIGLCSPIAGLELNVAIRTFEVEGERIWLGAGGGVVSDSGPGSEVEEALTKARGVSAAAGLTIEAAAVPAPSWIPRIVRANRPDPSHGVFETILVHDGRARHLGHHLDRLAASCRVLGLQLPPGLRALVAEEAAGQRAGGLRVSIDRTGVTVAARSAPDPTASTMLTPVTLPGGLGAHKWADRALIDSLSAPGSTPLFCDLDGTVLEAGYAAVLMVIGETLVAPPLDGRLLPSVSRAQVLRAAPKIEVRSFTLTELERADAIVLTSSLRGPHPGGLASGPALASSAVVCDQLRAAWGTNEEEEG